MSAPDNHSTDLVVASPDDVETALVERLRALTPTQRARFEAMIAGDTNSAIARREGVSPQAVDQSMRSANVRKALESVGEYLATSEVATVRRSRDGEDETVGTKSLTLALVENLVDIGLNATRTVVGGGGAIRSVPDYRLRVETSLRVLDLLKEADRPQLDPAVVDGHDTIVARERVTTSRTREIRSS